VTTGRAVDIGDAEGWRAVSRERGVGSDLRAAYKRGSCRWCLKAVEPPRRTFCGPECVHQWKLRSDPGYRRKRVFERDGGICGKCGRDCHALERDLLKMLYENPSGCDEQLARLGLTRRKMKALDHRVPLHLRGRMGEKVDPTKRLWEPGHSLWEADHVQAVVDGGGSCDLSNLQTLCFACHRDKTAELARRRAEARRNVRPPDDLFPARVVPPDDLFDD
jgi:5-methylcytosine-specific restriction enzyme A